MVLPEGRTLIFAFVFLFLFTYCQPDTKTKSSRSMYEELTGIYHQAIENPMPYFNFNSKRAEWMQTQAKDFTGEKLRQHNYYLARELLWAGRSEESIRILEQLLEESNADLESITPDVRPLVDELALAYLRLGEQQNCIEGHSSESCIMPIQGSGLQTQQESTRRAIEIYEKLLILDPDDYGSRWLLNVAYMSIGEYPDNVPESYLIKGILDHKNLAFPRFPNVAIDLGVAVHGLSGGLCIEDFNNDGHLDLFMTSYGLNDSPHFFIADGKGGYDDHTRESGLIDLVSGLNAVHADYDNDGDFDILILRGAWHADAGDHPNSLLQNNGDGTFTDVTHESGIISYHPTQTAAWADFNLDGYLDLFIGNESNSQWQDILAKNREGSGKEHPSELFVNNGDGTFTEIAEKVGIHVETFVKGSTWGDVNNDGLPDLFISVMGEPNLLYINKGGTSIENWKFEERAVQAGVQLPVFSFPAWFWDYNNDGWEDLFVSSYDFRHFTELQNDIGREYLRLPVQAERSCLYRNNGDGTFSNVAFETGLNKVLYSMGSNFGDLDNDGWLDFYVGTGAPDLRSIIPNRMFHNINGTRFDEVTFEGGFGHLQKGHALAFADLDRDGDQDIYAVMGGAVEGDVFPNVLFENPDGWNNNSWVTLQLEGKSSNRSAITARIELVVKDTAGKSRKIYRTVGTGGSFGAGSLQQEIGLGNATLIERLTITWPNSRQIQDVFENLSVNNAYLIVEGEQPIRLDRPKVPFKKGNSTGHSHHVHEMDQ